MARRKKDAPQPGLSAPVPAPQVEFRVPKILRYKPDAQEPWQIERFDLLAAEFSWLLESEAEAQAIIIEFHKFAKMHPRQWQIIRRLFGIIPLLPDESTSPDDMRIWDRSEMEAGGYEIDPEMDVMRKLWDLHVKREASAKQEETKSTALEKPAAPADELQLDDKILERFQFSERIFKIKVWDPMGGQEMTGADIARSDSENRSERDWFCERVRQWSKMLEDPMGAPVARSALMNDLYLRRLESEIALANSNKRKDLMATQNELSNEYNKAIEKLQEMFPELAIAGRITFRQTIGDLFVARQDYYGHGDRRLVDKIFTATEYEFMLRTSAQLGEKHRFSQGLVMVENIHGFYEPEFRSQFKHSTLKKIDASVRAAREALRQELNESVVDLEKGVLPGEGDDFEDFNDYQCPACQRWHPNGKKCPNVNCSTNQKNE